ncbi:hypothetical protein LTR99_001554 [Exophiala xenobiotica]|uniref:Uncharacterized protein n=1 Tax=Vermiconidia calcicola TaxID=1690605 RepID=A0AAV9QN28_9PEZI|nr:hypothetical protein LTR72_001033 [Exophiala xenobiotica]KAK5544063.1 hypothetical protein LTR25_001678 [Vermiconidia calcicola]KAK5547657.1 hypothetical protein LTR23_002410 [Chaetothyriales sp. CCFEE 6169]KAK5289586.1 hypothetical protein LTR14_007224 [Exophiala xenobiotica]KAK5308578.1 hypothetical protein LTR99_001554 [Exophiala xenobiotica]
MSRRPLRTTPIKFGRRSLYEEESDLPSEGSECLVVAQQPSAYELGCRSEEERPISTSVVAIWYPGVGWRYGDIQAWRDFPSAEHPPTWYSNSPVASGEPKPYFESALCRLPAELRTEIWKMYIEDNRGWDLNIDTPTWRTCSGRIRRSRDFITRGVENILQLSDLYAHNDLLRKPETEYPQLLRILSRDLPNLKWIRFSRKYTTDAIRIQQHGLGVNPHQWTYRAVVLLAAWLCLRHKNLDLLACYSSAYPDEEDDSTFHNFMCVELMSKAIVRSMRPPEAWVLNAPMIRRTPWSRIASMPASEFAIDPDSESSETMAGHEGFEKLDREGYTSRRLMDGEKRSIPIDRLIKICTKALERARNVGTQQPLSATADSGSTNDEHGPSTPRGGRGGRARRGRSRGRGRGHARGRGDNHW